MRLYLDASCIVPLFAPEPGSASTAAVVATAEEVIVSDYGIGEACAAIARKYREKLFTERQAFAALGDVDRWAAEVVTVIDGTAADVRRGQNFIRRLDLGLRFADALQIATAERCDAQLLTRDKGMANAASTLSLPVRLLD